MPIYGYPNVGRFGLGHSLLAWARCAVWCKEHEAVMLGPIWFRPRLGPYLRNERDKREYFRLFSNAPYASRLIRTKLLMTAKTVPAEQLSDVREVEDGSVVIFTNAYARNFETYFHEVADHGPFLREKLLAMTKPSFLPETSNGEPFVAIHVRLGDFQSFDAAATAQGHHNYRLPEDWYKAALAALRDALGYEIPAIVFSDGTDEELGDLLSAKSVRRAPDAASITHMLKMAEASCLISSGSGFSFWSTFLGEVPRIVYPEQGFSAVKFDGPTLAWAEGDQVPTSFLSAFENASSKAIKTT